MFRRLADGRGARVAAGRQAAGRASVGGWRTRGLRRFHAAALDLEEKLQLLPRLAGPLFDAAKEFLVAISLEREILVRQFRESLLEFAPGDAPMALKHLGVHDMTDRAPPDQFAAAAITPVDRGPSGGFNGEVIPTRRLVSRAQGYLELGMVGDAAAEIDRIPLEEIDALEVVAVRLALLQEQQDWPAVSQLAAAFVRRQPKEAAGWVTWAYSTRRAVSLDAAEKILLEAEKLHPAEATIQFNLGCYACQRGDLLVARQRVDRAIALNAKFAKAAETDPDLAPLRIAVTKKRR
jgi:tetratricopeptide (TPR) repeat protein